MSDTQLANFCDVRPDAVFDTEFISDINNLPASGVLCIISDKGTGKTYHASEVAKQFHRRDGLNKIMLITPRKALTSEGGNRLDCEYYEDIPVSNLSRVPRLAITLPSLEKFIYSRENRFPEPRLLVLDELSLTMKLFHAPKIMKRGKATRVFSVLERLIAKAELVLVMDADLTQIEIDWLRTIRKDVFVAYNKFRRQCGDLYLYATQKELTSTFIDTVLQSTGPVTFASSSKGAVKALAEILENQLGEEAVLSIHADNYHQPRQKAFIANPDKEIQRYRAVLFSPSLMTGIDIQFHIEKKFAAFDQPLDGPGCAQQLERIRNAKEAHVWVSATERSLETDPQAIFDNYIQKAQDNFLLALDENNRPTFDGVLRKLHRIQSQIEARVNSSQNNLREDFLRIVSGNYTIHHMPKMSSHHAEAITTSTQELKKRRKRMVLSTLPMLPEEHKLKREAGILTDEDDAGLERFRIEAFYGMAITEDLYDFDRDGKGRGVLENFINCFCRSDEEVRKMDKAEIEDDTPIRNRSNLLAKRKLTHDIVFTIWGGQDEFHPDTILKEEDIIAKMDELCESHGQRIHIQFNDRSDHANKPLPKLRRILRSMGIYLTDKQSRDDMEKRHHLDAKKLSKIRDLADQRIKWISEQHRSQSE